MNGVTRPEISTGFALAALAALLAFVVVGHLAWLVADTAVTGYDELAFLDHLVKYRRLLTEAGPAEWLGYLHFSNYPALPFLAGHLAGEAGGQSIFSFRLVGVMAHLLWILAAFGIGRRLDRPLAGLVAAYAVGLAPLATILSAAMMLRYSLEQGEAADAIEAAVQMTLKEGYRTADIAAGKPAVSTTQMGDLVCRAFGSGK